jgi:hypothetical protein
MRGGQPAMVVLHLLATTASAVTPSPDPVLSIVAAARYGSRGVGSRPWLGKELCFAQPSRTCLQPMPGALIDTV